MAFHKGYIIAGYNFIPTSYDFKFLINKFFHLLLWEMQFINFNHSLTINWRGTLKYEIYLDHNKNLHLLLPSKKYNFPLHPRIYFGNILWVPTTHYLWGTVVGCSSCPIDSEQNIYLNYYSCYFSCLKRWMYVTF